MSITISRLVHGLRSASMADGRTIRIGPLEQLVAAALGYGTLASYQAAVTNRVEPPTLDAVEHLVLDANLVRERADDLGIPFSRLPQLLSVVTGQLLPTAQVHASERDFEDYLHDRLMYDAGNGSATSGPIACTNPDGIDEIYLPFDLDLDASPVGEPEFIQIEGHVNMGIDIEKPYSGHHIDVTASVSFTRIGKRLLIDVRAGVDEAALDYNW